MTYLFYDTETSGLPTGMDLGHTSQPHIVQLAMILTDEELNPISEVNIIVKPDGWTIPENVAAIHGITNEKAEKYGVPEKAALRLFQNFRNKSNFVVAHNIKFDNKIIAIAEKRFGENCKYEDLVQNKCTMETCLNILKLPPTSKMVRAGFIKYKPPKLSEAYKHFFNEDLVGAHDAMIDVRACMKIFKYLKLENLI